MTHDVVVLGAGYAGLTAVNRLAGRLRNADARVTLVNARDHFVERVRLHQLAAGQQLRRRSLRDLTRDRPVALAVGEVTGIDLAGQVVHVAGRDLRFDTLIYALGSEADLAAVPGAAEHASTVATYEAASALRARLSALPREGVVAVVGGGLTGIETAAELAGGRRVELLTAGTLAAGVSAGGRDHLRRGLHRLGVTVREQTRVAKVTPDGVVLADGSVVAADETVWTAGFRAPALAARAGLAVDAQGRVLTDAVLRSTSHPHVYAAGDAAAALVPDGRVSRMSCQTGLPMGAQVADIVAGELTGRSPRPPRIRYVWQNISLGRHDGLTQFVRTDDTPVGATLTGRTAAGFKEAVTRATILAVRRPGLGGVRGGSDRLRGSA